jgi:hypothetical protein
MIVTRCVLVATLLLLLLLLLLLPDAQAQYGNYGQYNNALAFSLSRANLSVSYTFKHLVHYERM